MTGGAARALLDSLLAAPVGRVLTQPSDTDPFLWDWRRQWHGSALAVVQPGSTQEVAAVIRWCAEHQVAVVPQGGNTGLSGGATPSPDGTSIVLSLARLNRIRAVDPVNNTITAEAGCVLHAVQEAALGVGRYFPLSLAAEGSCTIGGNLATNAGGTAVLRYGSARALCLGLEVVTADGSVWDGLKSLRKDNSGYDLRDLFIGSEGTLGVITAATLALHPSQGDQAVALIPVGSIHEAVSVFEVLRGRLDQQLTACEVMSGDCIELVASCFPSVHIPFAATPAWVMLAEVSAGSNSAEVALVDALALVAGMDDALVATASQDRSAMWALRELISEAQAAVGPAIKHDVAVPISALGAFASETAAAVAREFPEVRQVVFGHLGDGNLHYNCSPQPGFAADRFTAMTSALNAVVHDLVRAHGGSISAEHGLGVLRKDEADAHRSAVERRLMQSIKSALDPLGIMNPGKVLPTPGSVVTNEE
jgi:FAD/FMN-containing dehydrogenase